MRTVQLEFAAVRSSQVIASRLAAAGLSILGGHDPVPMRGRGADSDTIVVTVLAPIDVTRDALLAIPGVLRVLGDVRIAPMSDLDTEP